MPPEIAAWVSGFVERHHVERPSYKRRRDRSERGAGSRAEMEADDDE
jgi:hypothetical protein